MQPIIVVDNEYITVRYLPDKKIVYHTVHKPIESRLFMEALDAGGEVLRQNGAHKWLSDDRKNGPLSPEMIAGPKIWGPGMIAAGWKYWANVVPKDIMAAGALVPVMETLLELGLRMMVFTTVEDAFRWLESMKD
jgi:hypothetical protein